MQFSPSAPRKNVTINEVIVSIPQPFVAGHVCTAGEAASLNQTLIENTRNNLAGKAKREKDPVPVTQEGADDYVANYEFGARGGSRSAMSPVERKAYEIAEAKVREAIKAQGIKFTEVPDEDYDALVEEVAAQPEVIKAAEKQVRDMQKMAVEGVDLSRLKLKTPRSNGNGEAQQGGEPQAEQGSGEQAAA